MAIFTPEGSPHILIATAPRVDEAKWSDWQDRLTLGKSIRHRLPKLWDATFGMQEATRDLNSRTLPESALGANGFTYRDRFVIPAMGVDLDGIEILGAIMCANKRARGFRLLLFASPDTYSHWGRDFAIGMIELPLPDEWSRPDTYFLSSKDKDIAAQLVDYSFSKASYGERNEQIHDLARLYDLRFASRAEDLEAIGTDASGNRHILVGGATAGRMRDDSLRAGAKFDEEGVTPAAPRERQADGHATEEPADAPTNGDDFEDYVPEQPEEHAVGKEAAESDTKASRDATADDTGDFTDYEGDEAQAPDDTDDTDGFEDYSPEDQPHEMPAGSGADPEAVHRAYEAISAWDEGFEDYEAPGQGGGETSAKQGADEPPEEDAPGEDDTEDFGDWEPTEPLHEDDGGEKPHAADATFDEPGDAMSATNPAQPMNAGAEPPVDGGNAAARPVEDDAERMPASDAGDRETSMRTADVAATPAPAEGRAEEDVGDDIVDYIGEWEDETDEVFAPKRPDMAAGHAESTMPVPPSRPSSPSTPREGSRPETEPARVDPRPVAPDGPAMRSQRRAAEANEWIRAVRRHISELCGASDAHLSAFGRSLLGQALVPASVMPTQAKATAAMAEILRRMGAPAMTDEQILSVRLMAKGEVVTLPDRQSKDMPVMVAALASAITSEVVRIVVPNDERAASDARTADAVMSRCAGIRVGYVTGRMGVGERDAAYGRSVVYGTAETLAADWLRDNLSTMPVTRMRRPNLVLSSDIEGCLLGAIGRHVHVDGTPDGRGAGKAAIDCNGWLLSAERLGGTLRERSPYVRELSQEYPGIDWLDAETGRGAADIPGISSDLGAAAGRIADAKWSEAFGALCRQAYDDRRPMTSVSDLASTSGLVRSLISTEARKVATGLARGGGDENAHAALVWYAETGGGQDAVRFRKAVLDGREEDAYVILCGMLAADFEEGMAACGGEKPFVNLVKTTVLRTFDALWANVVDMSERRTGARMAGSRDASALQAYEEELHELYARGIDRMPREVLSGVLHACDGMRP